MPWRSPAASFLGWTGPSPLMQPSTTQKIIKGLASYYVVLLDQMRQQPIPQLGFKPGALRGHDLPAIRDVKQLIDTHRVKTKSRFHLAAVHPALQLRQPPDTSYKVNSFIGPGIFYGQQFVENVLLQDRHIQYADWIGAITTLFCHQFIPVATSVHPKLMELS